LKVGYVQWGPLFRAADNSIICTKEALQCLIQMCFHEGIVNVLRVVPNAEVNHRGDEFSALLTAVGFEKVSYLKPYFTMMLKVDDSEEHIRGRLHRSWRRYLNRAESRDIEIREGTDGEYFNVLEHLYESAIERKKFKGLAPQVFVRTQQLLSSREKMHIIVAFWRGDPVTAHATSHLGDMALGVLAASSEKGLECDASYLVWWQTLLAAKRAGSKRYDLGGIDPRENPKVYQFKRRMGAEECKYIGAYDICMNTAVKYLWFGAEHIYRFVSLNFR